MGWEGASMSILRGGGGGGRGRGSRGGGGGGGGEGAAKAWCGPLVLAGRVSALILCLP